jgi:N-acetyl-anhydromuramyl-L-alanine amidase AmpD
MIICALGMLAMALGKDTDINSSSIGIELDNNGTEAFSELQITSLMALLSKLKKGIIYQPRI